MPRVNFKCIQQENNNIVCGVYVCLIPLLTSIVECTWKSTENIRYGACSGKSTFTEVYRMESTLILISGLLRISSLI
jgi:hypothetical protein